MSLLLVVLQQPIAIDLIYLIIDRLKYQEERFD